jgi:hypothetical protein
MNEFATLEAANATSPLKHREPFILQSTSGGYFSSAASSAGTLSEIFGRHVVLGVRADSPEGGETKETTQQLQPEIELPLLHPLTIFSGTSCLLCNQNATTPEWVDESKSDDSQSQFFIVRSSDDRQQRRGASSWLSWLQRSSRREYLASGTSTSNTGNLCFGDAVHLVTRSSSARSSSAGAVDQYLTMTGQNSTRKSRAAAFVISKISLQQLNSLKSSSSGRHSRRRQRAAGACATTNTTDESAVEWSAPLLPSFPLHLLLVLIRQYFPRGLGLHTARLLCTMSEKATHGYKISAQNDFSSIKVSRILSFVSYKCKTATSIRLRNFYGAECTDLSVATSMRPLMPRSPLRCIDFCGCPLISDATCRVLCTLEPSLVSVKLGCTSVTDEGVSVLLASPATLLLEDLNLYGCRNVTEVGMDGYLSRLMETRTTMRSINIRGTAIQRLGHLDMKDIALTHHVALLVGKLKIDGAAFYQSSTTLGN